VSSSLSRRHHSRSDCHRPAAPRPIAICVAAIARGPITAIRTAIAAPTDGRLCRHHCPQSDRRHPAAVVVCTATARSVPARPITAVSVVTVVTINRHPCRRHRSRSDRHRAHVAAAARSVRVAATARGWIATIAAPTDRRLCRCYHLRLDHAVTHN